MPRGLCASLAAAVVSAALAHADAPPRADTVVAADGSGQWKSLAAAIDAAPAGARDRRWVIRVKPGVYRESIRVPRAKRFLVLAGDDAASTVIRSSGPAVIEADDFAAVGLTFDDEVDDGRATVVRGSRARFLGCRFVGAHDGPREDGRDAADLFAAAPVPEEAAAPCDGRLQADVEYARAGGERLALDVCVPNGRGPFAAVLLVHGGGWSSGDRTQAARALRGPLVAAGIGWIALDYRLAPRHRHPAAVEDVRAAVVWTKAHAAALGLDPGRLALLGESAGGHVAVSAVVSAGEDARVAAVVPFFAPVDLAADTERRGGLSSSLRGLFGLETVDDATRRVLREASPLQRVRPGLPPFLLVHGTADMSVPYEQSLRLREALRSADVSCALVTVPDGTHGTRGWDRTLPGWRDQVVAWLQGQLRAASAAGARAALDRPAPAPRHYARVP
ncbi:MAG: pectinesterase family protein [Vicinamibacteria bacterium]